MRTPFSLDQTLALNGQPPMDTGAVRRFIADMGRMTPNARVNAFLILGDFYCRWCGAEQPPGDCQCRTP